MKIKMNLLNRAALLLLLALVGSQLTPLFAQGTAFTYQGRLSVGNSLANNGEVPVTPAADLRHFTIVQVLTAPHPGTARAQAPTPGKTG